GEVSVLPYLPPRRVRTNGRISVRDHCRTTVLCGLYHQRRTSHNLPSGSQGLSVANEHDGHVEAHRFGLESPSLPVFPVPYLVSTECVGLNDGALHSTTCYVGRSSVLWSHGSRRTLLPIRPLWH